MTNHPHPPDRWRGQSYHGQPALKYPQWDSKVSGYIAIAGAAGAAQALAWTGGLLDPRGFRCARRNARWMGLAASAAGSGLLIADLKTPRRFFNMVRILRPTSPMSFGTYILGAFVAATTISLLADLPGLRRRPPLRALADVADAGAAVTGAGAATYTAALLSATSNPQWAAAPRALAAQFAASSVAAGAAALALGERAGGRRQAAEKFEAVATVATLVQAGASLLSDARHRQTGTSEADASREADRRTKLLLATAVPIAALLVGRAAGERGGAVAALGSASMLVGSWLLREETLNAGRRAAHRPEAAFSLAQQRHLPGTDRQRRSIGVH